jgi:hypothetical protein
MTQQLKGMNPMLQSFSFFSVSILISAFQAYSGPAHNHHEAKIQIAHESGKGLIDITLPAHVVMGFEHAPRNPKEVKKADSGMKNLKEQAPRWFHFSAQAECQLKEPQVDWIRDQSEHSEVRVKINFECRQNLLGQNLKLGLRDTYPQVKTIKLEALVETLQKSWNLNKQQSQIEFKQEP